MRKNVFNAAALFGAGLIAGVVAVGVSQDSKPASQPTMEQMMKEMAEMPADQMMEMYMKSIDALVAKHPEQYAALKACAGEWNVMQTHMMGGEGSTSEVHESGRMMGDYWLIADTKGDAMGMPMEGHLIAGYDPMKEKSVGVWVDTIAPVMMVFEGEYDPETKTSRMASTITDPMTGLPQTYYMEEKWTGPDTREWVMTMDMGGQEIPMMKSVYKRAE